MSAINSLDQITGEVAKIKWLDPGNKSDHPNPLYILVLGEGFTNSDEVRFIDFIKELKSEFFKIAPFGYCRPYISFLYCFLPSETSGLLGFPDESDGSFRRVFRLFVQGSRLRPQDEQHTLRVVYRLKLPHDLVPPPWLETNSASIWFDKKSKSYGAIAVIANTNPIDYPDVLGATNFSPEIPQEVLKLAGRRAQWFTMGMNGYDVQPGSLYGRYPNLFAHELCHSLNLYDEYEETTSEYSEPPGEGNIVEYRMSISNNVQRIDSMDPATVLETLKWKEILSSSERTKIRSDESIFTKEDLVSMGVLSNTDEADRYIHLVNPRTQKFIHWSQVFLVEGAKYRRKMYRPHFECKMRFDTYDERVTNDPRTFSQIQGDRITYGSPEFCRVCNFNIRKAIMGWDIYGIGALNRKDLEELFYEELMPRLNRSFELQGTGLTTDGPFCDISSARIYIMLRQLNYDARFVITRKHVSIYLNGIYLDPVFFDWYRMSGDLPSTTYSYIDTRTGDTVPLPVEDRKKGRVGDISEFWAYLVTYKPQVGSMFRGVEAGVEGITEDVYRYYKVKELWFGPFHDPTPDFAMLEEATPGSAGYIPEILDQWNNWIAYTEGGEYNYLHPLDMGQSLEAALL